MFVDANRRLSLSRAFSGLLVCWAIGFAGQSLEASCGHYVQVDGLSAAMADAPRQARPAQMPAVPCHGPGCRSKAPEPFLPPVNVPQIVPSDVVLDSLASSAGWVSSWLPREASPVLIGALDSGIFHPPRLLSGG